MEEKAQHDGMISMKYTRISTYLIFLTIFLLIINIVMIYFIFNTVKVLENDASIINRMGIARGSIQRITKLEISGNQNYYNELILQENLVLEVDLQIAKLLEDKALLLLAKEYADFSIENIKLIQTKWQNLKLLLANHQENPSKNNLIDVLNESEEIWYLASSVALNAQKSTENKVSAIKEIYIILFFYLINVLVIIWIVYSYVRKNLEFKASYDALTGLANRHSYEKTIEAEIERSNRYKTKFSLIIYDVDYFKKINDTYGHESGDKILIELSSLVKTTLRKSDEVFRVGGEEFAIIAPETDAANALVLADKIRKVVEAASFHNNIKVTLSLGVAESYSGSSISNIYRQADIALYKAKNSGRKIPLRASYSLSMNSALIH